MDTASRVVTEEAHNVFPFGLVFDDQMFGLSIVAAGCLEEDREKHTGPVASPDSFIPPSQQRSLGPTTSGCTSRGVLKGNKVLCSHGRTTVEPYCNQYSTCEFLA